MPMTTMPPGLMLDRPPLGPSPYWRTGSNIRFRQGQPETIGLFAPLRDGAGDQVDFGDTEAWRTIFTTPSVTEGQILVGSANQVQLLDFSPLSTAGTGTRWRSAELTPAGLNDVGDVVSDPNVGRVEVPPVWWFDDNEDVVVGGRANVTGDPIYVWDRNRANAMVPLAGSPTGAVGGGIISRLLVLLGCTSFTDPDPRRYMTIRWSDRFNFEDWTPSDINVTGELQLEGGSRIMGGGVIGQGVIAWTDKRMALLTETGDPDSVFQRRYIDGGRGLMANRAWCEADGIVWWYDETRTLNVWDGGRPTQVPNPLRSGTLERLTDTALARAYLVPNQEFAEIILWIPSTDADVIDTALVYNYVEKAWSIWNMPRNAWAARVGAIRNLGIDDTGKMYQHDLDVSMADAWLPDNAPPLTTAQQLLLEDTLPFDWHLRSNLITTENPTVMSAHITRQLLDNVPSPADPDDADTFTLTITGYGENSITSTKHSDPQVIEQGQTEADFRVGGKLLELEVRGTQTRTVWRFGQSGQLAGADGER